MLKKTLCLLIVIVICMSSFVSCSIKAKKTSKDKVTHTIKIELDNNSNQDTLIQTESVTNSLNNSILKSNYGESFNLLIVGLGPSESLIDVIMVATYDLNKNTINILQIPKDTYIGDTVLKIRESFTRARQGELKINALIECINNRLGLPIDCYATITINGNEKIIDAMGGITFNLDKAYTLHDDTRSPEIKKYFPVGKTHLDGQWATAFLRHIKSFAQGDLGRLKNHRSIYAEILKKLQTLDDNQLESFSTEVSNSVNSNITVSIMKLLIECTANISLDKIQIYSIPGQTATISGQSCWVCHKQETLDMLNEYFVPYGDKLTLEDMEIVDYAERGSYYDNSYGEFLEGGSLNDFDKDKTE